MMRAGGWCISAAGRAAILLPIVVLAGADGDLRVQAQGAPRYDLTSGRRLELSVRRGDVQTLSARLDAGAFLDLDVEPKGVALALEIIAPRGRTRRTVEPAYTSEGPVALHFVAPVTGRYTVRVSATTSGGPSGHASVIVNAIRPATAEDRARSEAEQALCDGVQLRAEGTAASLQSAVQQLQRAATAYEAIGDRVGRADAFVALAFAHYNRGDNQDSLDASARALDLSREIHDPRREAAALDIMGQAANEIGDGQRALTHYASALDIRRAIGELLAEAETLNNIGVVHDALGDVERAVAYYEQSLDIKRRLQLKEREGASLNNLGWALFTLGDMNGALERYREALRIRQAQRDLTGESITLMNIGSVYLSLGDAQTAREYYRRSAHVAARAGNKVQLGTLGNNRGFAEFHAKNYRGALEQFSRTLELRRAAQDATGEAVTLNNIGRTYGALGDREQETAHFAAALALIRKVGDKRWEANILNNIGGGLVSRGELPAGARHFADALKLARVVGDQRAEAVATSGLARAAAAQGDLDRALSLNDRALEIVESLRAGVASPSLRASYFATLREPFDFAVDVLMRLHEQQPAGNHHRTALEVVERGRGRMLLEALRESRATLRSGIDPELRERERSLRRLIEGKRERQMQMLRADDTTDADLAAIKRELDDLLLRERELDAVIRARSPHYAALTRPPMAKTEALQQLLDDDTVVLSYTVAEPRSYVWTLTRREVTAVPLPGERTITAAAQRVSETVRSHARRAGEPVAHWRERSSRGEAAFRQHAAALSRLILSPVAARLGARRLVIISDGALHAVPMTALPDPRSPAQPLIASDEVVRLPSLNVLGVLRASATERRTPTKDLAVFADPVFDSADSRLVRPRVPSTAARGERLQFQRLPLTRDEGHAILALVPPGRGSLALDFDATRAAVRDQTLSGARIIHFATHGVVSDRPDLSGLVLSLVDKNGAPQNGFLSLDDVYNLRLNADLVVTSACDTAVGREVKGEGLVALSRGFMHAGARQVVGSLWKVDDTATLELMQRFYKGFLSGQKSVAAALRDAQRDMWRQPRWSSPFYWAAFELQGDWR